MENKIDDTNKHDTTSDNDKNDIDTLNDISDKLKDEFGAKYFRSVRLIKNSYGEDDIRIGLGFLGQAGIFKELPKRKDITDADYQSVVDKTFFLNK